MKYISRVMNYFHFTSGLELRVNQQIRKSVSISGTLKMRTICAYLFIVLFFSIFGFVASMKRDAIMVSLWGIDINLTWGLTLIGPIVVALLILLKGRTLFKKIEPKLENINLYQRELPSRLKPGHVRMLLTDGLIDETTVAATLLDLIDNGYITLSKDKTKLDVFGREEIVLTKTNKNCDDLLRYEKFLLDWFIGVCGDGMQVSNMQIKSSLADVLLGRPSELFEQFQALVIISFPFQKFYQDNRESIYQKKMYFYVIVLFLAFLLITWPISSILFTYALGNLFFTKPMYFLNQRGIEERDRWLSLKRFLVEFSNIQDKTLEMVAIWEYYLVYSIALDIDSKASREMKNFFGDQIYSDHSHLTEKVERKTMGQRERMQELKREINDFDVDIEKDIKEELEKYEKILNH